MNPDEPLPEIRLAFQSFELDTPKREIRGKITVFGVNAEDRGLILAAGCLEPRQPLKRVKLLRDHDMAQPVGYMTEFTQTDTEAHATFHIPAGADGDRALLEAENGLRDGLSVGIMPLTDGYHFDDEWNLTVTRAELYETSLCAIPAFQDAQVESVAAAVALARKQHDRTATVDPEETTPPTAAPAPVAPTEPAAPAPAVPRSSFARTSSGIKLTARQQFMADISSSRDISLALAPIIQADVFDATTVPEYVGEIWTGRGFTQRFVPLFARDTLTSQEVQGWRWVQTPDVGPYAGNLAEVPTNPVTAAPFTAKAERTASGHKIDRIHVDLPNPAFWDSFYKERADNYARLMDEIALAHLLAPANNTAVTVAAGSSPWRKLIRGARHVLTFAVPDYAIVGGDLYEEMLETTDQDKIAMLNSSLGLEEGRLDSFRIIGAPADRPDLDGRVLVGATAANELRELPGGPIRVEALDVAHGGVDAGLYGYHAKWTRDKRGVVSVTEAAAAV